MYDIAGTDGEGNQIASFSFKNMQVRIVVKDGEPWFAAHDVAVALEYRDAHNLTRILKGEEKGTHKVGTCGGKQSLLVINEKGLYRAIFNSRKPEALAFQDWVFGEVLPAIRKQGFCGQSPSMEQPPDACKDEKTGLSAAREDGPYTTHRIPTAATRLAIQPGAAVFCVMPDNRVRTFAWRFCYTTNTLITGDINKTLYWMREGNMPIPWEYEEIDGPFRIRPSSDASGVLMAVNDEGEPAPRDLHLLPAAKVILIGMQDEVEAMLDEEGLQFSRFITKRTSSRGFLENPK